MDRDRVIAALAQILEGLQVPLSLDGRLLGTATQPYREILRDSGFGWRNEEDFSAYLRRTLAPAAAATGETL